MNALAVSDMSFGSLSIGSTVLLVLALGLALAFEFVNGFHDTANAVATVIYTNSLKPWVAVIWSGFWNLIGVLCSTGGVAFGVLALLPMEMVVNVDSSAGFAMVFAVLLSAIVWNFGTWYLGLPASSSHSLFGAILGVGLASSLISSGHHFGDGINWRKLYETLLSLMISPAIGFVFAGLLLLASKSILRWPALYKAPEKDKAPPIWIRGLLILTCTGVSFGHGSNDGQKGMGLILLILIGILPGTYALNSATSARDIAAIHSSAVQVDAALTQVASKTTMAPGRASELLSAYLKNDGGFSRDTLPALAEATREIANATASNAAFTTMSVARKSALRTDIYLASSAFSKVESQKQLSDSRLIALLDGTRNNGFKHQLDQTTKFIPFWVKVATALALGLGTMVGWKRIVVTVGEKIGKTHLTYAEGASAELVAMSTIFLADRFNLPVSTTHVLSSGVAGTMAANKSGLQVGTLRNLILAWVLTLPVCVLLGAALFGGGLLLALNNFAADAAVGVVIAMGIVVWRLRRPTNGKREPRGIAMPAV